MSLLGTTDTAWLEEHHPAAFEVGRLYGRRHAGEHYARTMQTGARQDYWRPEDFVLDLLASAPELEIARKLGLTTLRAEEGYWTLETWHALRAYAWGALCGRDEIWHWV